MSLLEIRCCAPFLARIELGKINFDLFPWTLAVISVFDFSRYYKLKSSQVWDAHARFDDLDLDARSQWVDKSQKSELNYLDNEENNQHETCCNGRLFFTWVWLWLKRIIWRDHLVCLNLGDKNEFNSMVQVHNCPKFEWFQHVNSRVEFCVQWDLNV